MIEKKRLPIPREDVMAWYADEAHHRMWGEADHCYAYRMYLLGKLDAKQAAQQQAEPGAGVAEGHVLVPRVLTQAMDAAMDRAMKLGSNQHLWDEAIAAAPTQQQEGGHE